MSRKSKNDYYYILAWPSNDGQTGWRGKKEREREREREREYGPSAS
jgi:hypothetical protein